MTNKLTSAITEVSLNQATFHNKTFAPSYINFLFGNNGCGKSTVAKVLKDKIDLTWDIGCTADDYLMLVYNEEFIKNNIASYGGMPGVFTISEQNTQTQKEIEDATAELGTVQKTFAEASSNLAEKETLLNKQYDAFQTICWENTKDFRRSVDAALVGKKTKDGLSKALLSEATPKMYDEASLISICEAAFSKDATTYPELYTVDITTIPNSTILTKKIMSSSDSPFSTFMKAINATDWVRQGHEDFHTDGICPYCQRELPENFEEEIAYCFDKEYESDLATLKSFKNSYISAVNKIENTLKTNLQNAYPKIKTELTAYSKLLDVFKTNVELNTRRFDEKFSQLDSIIELEDLTEIITELNNMILTMNSKIQKNNEVVNDKSKMQPQCKSDVIKHLAFILSDEIQKYRNSRSALQKEIDTLTLEKSKADDKIKSIRRHLSDLRKQIVNTSAAVEGINTLLTDTGFQGFFIREKEDIPNVYEVIRTGTGKVAENLSEGERNFIAFLYFHQLVLGSLEADSDVKDKIVVIDDPVSSMDSSTLFVVGALVRDMIAICNPDYVTKEHPKDYIKQIFILTHNAFFHQEVTYNQAQHYRFVSFFEIVKLDNNSDVILCTQSNRETPSIKENRNPIQNSYAALWDTYKEVSSPNTLVNVIRQILDYYFLQLCGYSGIDIKDIILKNHRDDFITRLPDGTDDCSDLHMAASLLQYLCTSNDRISDGLNFIHASVDTDSCRRIFESIFRHMGQGQHFDMMIKR